MLRVRWLNLVLLLTNNIFKRKQSIIGGVGLGVVINIIILILQEIALGFLSLPLYIGLKPANVTVYLEDKGAYDKVSFDYNLRRVLTLTGVSVIFIIWLIKLFLIIITPTILGPLQLYHVSDLRPVDLLERELVIAETQIQTARVMEKMIVPELTGVDKIRGGDYRFYGTGQPDTLIVLLISDVQTVILTNMADNTGNWELDLKREDFRLSEGNHAIVVFSFDEKQEIRSSASAQQYFKVQTTFLDVLTKNLDIFINASIIIVLAIGVLLTVLTL